MIRPGYLPVEQLAPLLGGAQVVAYPSLGEGFGLPVLEAMACGATVLTTRRLALPEVGGDAVAYTEPDAASIASALKQLLDDPAERQRLGEAAIKRAAGFTWDACAEAHIDAPTSGRVAMTTKLSVVVVTYSPGETLQAFLDSLPAATTAEVDVVLADNGSTDGSVERAQHAGKRPGRADGRQPGLRRCGECRGGADRHGTRR